MSEIIQIPTRIDGRDDWETPPDAFRAICNHWGLKPTVDVCASPRNHKCELYLTKEANALAINWTEFAAANHVKPLFWMNPPYSKPALQMFIQKAILEAGRGGVTIFLLPDRTDRGWYHDLIKRYPHEFWKGRIAFIAPDGIQESSPRYGNMHGLIGDFDNARQ